MLLSGLVIGVLLGASQGAKTYDLARVARLDALILCAVGSALVAGHTAEWRRGVVRGVMVAAGCVAVQLLITFCWSLATGSYFWSLFPFGRTVGDLASNIQSGNILTLRENAISGFLILPALSLLIFRFRKQDLALLVVLTTGGLLWLSRGLWVAMVLTLLIVVAHRAASRRLTGARLLTIAATVSVVVTVAFIASGGILNQRLRETTSLGGDVSLEGRSSETHENFDALTAGVGPFALGLGTGVVASPGAGTSPLLENTVLAIWTNAGLLGLCGVTLLFFGAGYRGWQIAASHADEDSVALGAMCLSLPVLWLQGLVGGIFSIEQAAVTLFLLATTVLVTPHTPATNGAKVGRGGVADRPGSPARVWASQ